MAGNRTILPDFRIWEPASTAHQEPRTVPDPPGEK